MRSRFCLPLFSLLFLFILTGCPYKSEVPIDEGQVKINAALIGKWAEEDKAAEENPTYFEITKIDDYKYMVVNNEYSSYDSTYTKTNYIAHLSVMEGLTFLNMLHDGFYHLHKVVLSEDHFTLFEVTDNIDETFDSAEELKAFVQKYMHLSFFYNKDEKKYVRM